MMRYDMTTSRRAEAQNGEVTGKNLSMYTMSICHAECCKFQLHRLNIEWIGTVFHSVKDSALVLGQTRLWTGASQLLGLIAD